MKGRLIILMHNFAFFVGDDKHRLITDHISRQENIRIMYLKSFLMTGAGTPELQVVSPEININTIF